MKQKVKELLQHVDFLSEKGEKVKSWQVAIIVTIIIAVIGLAGSGWSQRPIIDYYMSGNDQTSLPDSWNFSNGFPLRVGLIYDNRGGVDIDMNLVFTVMNANITVDKQLEPWIQINGTTAIFNVAAQMHTGLQAYYVNVFPVGNPQNFTLAYSFEDTTPILSVNGIISHLFIESNAYYPTFAVYNRTETNLYQLLE